MLAARDDDDDDGIHTHYAMGKMSIRSIFKRNEAGLNSFSPFH